MKIELTPKQKTDQAEFRAFASDEIVPHADHYDREESIPSELVRKLARQGYLGSMLPGKCGGKGLDMITYGLLNEEIGRACSSVRSLLTVHDMVAQALNRWGNQAQKEKWMTRLASGQIIGAFALSEPNVGSDAEGVETTAALEGDTYVLSGRKKWISFGQIADLFLLFARCEGKPTAFLVERNSPGLSIRPIKGILGVRASMLAQLELDDCRIAKENLIGRVGFGVSHVALSALDQGRYSVAWGCVGIAQACLEACLKYTSERKQFGAYLKDHQLIQSMIANMTTKLKAARLLCYQAGYLKDVGDPGAIMETSIAKYFVSKVVNELASDAVQIHGANGYSSDYPVQRYFRDAKLMEIIEGSTQIQEMTIAKFAYFG
jgi:hypothetical protein